MTAPPAQPGAAARRLRYGVTTLVLLVAATVAAVSAAALGGRFAARFDVTATREHSLSERTASLLATLDEPHRIVVSADFGRVPPRVRQRVLDVLAAFGEGSAFLDVAVIDAGAPGAAEAFGGVVADAAALRPDDLEAHRAGVERAASDAARLADALEAVSRDISAFAERFTSGEDRRLWRESARIVSLLADEARAAGAEAGAFADSGGAGLPEADRAAEALRPVLDRAANAMASATQEATALMERAEDSGARSVLRAIADGGAQAGAIAAGAADRFDRLPTLDALTVARVLRSTQAVLVIGPGGAAAVSFDALFPGGEATEASVVFAGEGLIGAALASVRLDPAPTVVFIHAERSRLLDDSGAPTPGARPIVGNLLSDLRQRRIRVVEWPVALSPLRPVLPNAERVVWFVMGPPGGSGADRVDRVTRLGEAVQGLLSARENVLLTVLPSDLPGVGEADPLVAALPSMGVASDSGRAIVTRRSEPSGARFLVEHLVRRKASDHPLAESVDGLAVRLRLATALDVVEDAPEGVRAWPLLRIDDDDQTWAESGWAVLGTPRAAVAPPTPDERRDDLDGPWTVAVAAERAPDALDVASGEGRAQRLVVVSGALWFADPTTTARAQLEGRVVAAFPGNAELFDNAILYLAGLDELLAPSATARDIPRIAALSDAQLGAIRWSIAAGMPLLVLAIGGALRILRG